MRLAWFRPKASDLSDLLDDLGSLITALRANHHIDLIDAARAHDFVWMHARGDYDLCVYEISNDTSAQFIWPYLLAFPGVLALRTTSLHNGRAAMLAREQRLEHYATEMAFSGATRRITSRWGIARGSWPMLRVPLLASRLAVVCDSALTTSLERDYPGARVRYAPVGVEAMPEQRPRASHDAGGGRVTFGVTGASRSAAISGAAERALAAGAQMALVAGPDHGHVLREADVIMALHWPSGGEPLTAARVAMAAGKAVIVSETWTTAGWPALDPQTWRPRDESGTEPIVISIDPRDEEHSLMLAMRRLSTDAALRHDLGTSARRWAEQNATVAQAAEAWTRILQEASTLSARPRPADWPRHLPADGTERVRELLAPFGVSVDFLT